MDLSSLFLAALVVLPAAAFATWTWLAMRQIEDDLRELGGLDPMDFEA